MHEGSGGAGAPAEGGTLAQRQGTPKAPGRLCYGTCIGQPTGPEEQGVLTTALPMPFSHGPFSSTCKTAAPLATFSPDNHLFPMVTSPCGHLSPWSLTSCGHLSPCGHLCLYGHLFPKITSPHGHLSMWSPFPEVTSPSGHLPPVVTSPCGHLSPYGHLSLYGHLSPWSPLPVVTSPCGHLSPWSPFPEVTSPCGHLSPCGDSVLKIASPYVDFPWTSPLPMVISPLWSPLSLRSPLPWSLVPLQ